MADEGDISNVSQDLPAAPAASVLPSSLNESNPAPVGTNPYYPSINEYPTTPNGSVEGISSQNPYYYDPGAAPPMPSPPAPVEDPSKIQSNASTNQPPAAAAPTYSPGSVSSSIPVFDIYNFLR